MNTNKPSVWTTKVFSLLALPLVLLLHGLNPILASNPSWVDWFHVPKPPSMTSAVNIPVPVGQVMVRFKAAGKLDSLWKGWTARLKASGYRLTHQRRQAGMSSGSFCKPPCNQRFYGIMEKRGSFIEGELRGFPLNVKGASYQPPGRCRSIPSPNYTIKRQILRQVRKSEVEKEKAHKGRKRRKKKNSGLVVSVVSSHQMRTVFSMDLDQDGILDAAVPSSGKKDCPDQVVWKLYVVRGRCGHTVGEVMGNIDFDAARRARKGSSPLVELATVTESRKPLDKKQELYYLLTHQYQYTSPAYRKIRTNRLGGRRFCKPAPCSSFSCLKVR